MPGTILVVDDTPEYVRLLSRLLSQRGYRVRSAEGGGAALELVAADPPDLVLLDIRMPGMDGYAVCECLKAQPATCDIPVIFVSSADDIGDKVRAFASGGVDHIAKPYRDEEVLARVATHIALRRLRQDLEARVLERTADLLAANEQLSAEIAERRRAEDKFRRVVEAAPEAMTLINARREIVLANAQAEALFGYGRDELLGRPVEMLMPERFRDAHARQGAAYLAAPRLRPMAQGRGLYGRCKDGREFPAEISLSPLGIGEETLVVCNIRDIGERKAIERELVESRERLRELAAHHDAVREEEKKRIAGEIHDELGSLLTALKMDIALLRMGAGQDDGIRDRIDGMRDLVEQTMCMVRQVATQLRPTALNLGIVPALEWLVEDFGRRTGIACTLAAAADVEIEDARATAIFRIVQESLTNVARHAAAATVAVSLARKEDCLELAIRDDGRGFDPQQAGKDSFGLLGVRERALLLGARLRIDSAPGRGTAVAISIPIGASPP